MHVLTQRRRAPRAPAEDRHGVTVHRVREPDFPKDDLDAFISWVDHMNEDMRAAGAELRRASSSPTSCTRTTGWSPAPPASSPATPACRGS